MWTRKGSATESAVQLPSHLSHLLRRQPTGTVTKQRSGGEDTEKQHELAQKGPQMSSPRSIIPETRDLPSWYHKDVWANVPLPASRIKYNIHNPIGPRWYKNHHLVPPTQTKPNARPPTVFSSSFPPIATSASQEPFDEPTLAAGPSRTPSGSPLPTPSSSQTRVFDANGKSRSRKNSETAHDNVDLMDVTDPWGTNWHHHSPYDVGLWNGSISSEAQDAMLTRTRRASMTNAQTGRQSIIPSPLSQSTSAVNLSTTANLIVQLPRKLSKRRPPTVDSVTSGQKVRKTISLPANPIEPSGPLNPAVIPSVLPISSFQVNTSKKEKRGSILDRLVKKFSLLRRSEPENTFATGKEDEWQHISTLETSLDPSRYSVLPITVCAPEEPYAGVLDNTTPAPVEDPPPEKVVSDAADADDSLSFEAPFSIGRLTVANPDIPSSGDTTPAIRETLLPPDKEEPAYMQSQSDTQPPIPPINFSESEMTILGENTPIQLPPRPLKGHEPELVVLEPPIPPEKTKVSIRPASVLSDATRNRVPEDIQHAPQRQTSSRRCSDHRTSVVSQVSQLPRTVPQVPEKPRPDSVVSSATPSIPFPSSSLNVTSTRKPVPMAEKPFSFYESSPFSMASILVNPPTPYARDSYRSPSPELHRLSALYSHSPASSSSVIANPPTPYSPEMIIPTPSDIPPAPLPKPSQDKPISSHQPATQNGRQTETFRLVRSPSGHVYSTNEMISASGHQWEVVEGLDKSKPKMSSRSKETELRDKESRDRELRDRELRERELKQRELRERESRDRNRESKGKESKDRGHRERTSKDKEHQSRDRHTSDRKERKQETSSSERRDRRRESKSQDDYDAYHRYHSRSHRGDKTKLGERLSTSTSAQPSRRGTDSPTSHGRHDSRKAAHRSSEEKERHKREDTLPVNVNKPQPAPPAPAPPVKAPVPAERRPSLTVRPNSQIHSAAELTALRAKEAWDMERLWKARSMNGSEPNGYIPVPSSTLVNGSADDPNIPSAVHGSSHTAFIVQNPFQTQHTIYHSMPVAPPPIIYSSPTSIPSIPSISSPATTHSQQPPKPRHQSSPAKSITSPVRSPASNPLPEPPRESMYEPASLSLTSSNGRSSDYWTKLAGITT